MQDKYAAVSMWAVMTVWLVVNAVNALQGIGFLSRVLTGAMVINYYLGFVIMLLAIPAMIALIAFIIEGASWIHWIGMRVGVG